MSRYGLLIDFEYCTGCHSCEVACKNERNLGTGKWGIKVLEDGPWQVDDDRWEYNFIPYITSICDLCKERVSAGRVPACVHHCLGNCMSFGTVEELAVKMGDAGDKVILLAH